MIYEDENNDEQDLELQPKISYKEYQKQLTKKPNEGLIIFVTAFFVMLLLFLGVVKQLSPDVDVTIGDNSQQTEEEVDKANVDDRLKELQMDDNSYKYDDNFSSELEEKVILPKQKVKTVGEQEKEAEVIVIDQNKNTPAKQIEHTPVQPVTNVSAKVIVGYYATAEQANVAKGIIEEAGLGINPFVKNIGDAYTLQVGSFSSKEKAQNVANDLLKNNFPARVIVE